MKKTNDRTSFILDCMGSSKKDIKKVNKAKTRSERSSAITSAVCHSSIGEGIIVTAGADLLVTAITGTCYMAGRMVAKTTSVAGELINSGSKKVASAVKKSESTDRSKKIRPVDFEDEVDDCEE